MVNKSIEQTMWSITLMSSIQNIVSPKTWTQKVILERSLIANTLPTWLTMEFDLFPLNIVGGVVSLASTWLTFEEDFLYSRQSNLPLAEFIFCNLWQTSIVWLCQTQLSHLRCARYLFEMCPTFLHIPHFRWGFLGVKVLLELRELFLTAKVVASSNNVLLLDIPCCFFILEGWWWEVDPWAEFVIEQQRKLY